MQLKPPVPTPAPTPPPTHAPLAAQPIDTPAPLAVKKTGRSIGRIVAFSLAGLIGLLVLAGIGGYLWYQDQLRSPAPQSSEKLRLTVKNGDTSANVAAELVRQGAIKNRQAFELYYRFNQKTGLKTGVYLLDRKMDVPQMVAHLESGKPDEFTLTFLPGGTVRDAKQVLTRAGYDQAAVDAAFAKTYNHPLFATKPAGVGLEGYIFGDTYNFYTGASPEEILTKVFDHMNEVIAQRKLDQAFEQRGMTRYQGIILASIIQKEVAGKSDMATVSQIFHSRLAQNISLGADATFVYAARQQGVAPRVDLPSPYNTRLHTGLPPGPIAAPGVDALVAAAKPAPTDYLYFVSGDDGKTYFSKTNEEHERLTRQYCVRNCALPAE